MKRGGFIVNGHPYQFFSKEHTFINHFLNLGTTRRGGFWDSSNKGGRRMGAAQRKGFRENLRRAGRWAKKRWTRWSSQQVGHIQTM